MGFGQLNTPTPVVQAPPGTELGEEGESLECESAGKPDALQTLCEFVCPGVLCREAFGVRPACRRFRALPTKRLRPFAASPFVILPVACFHLRFTARPASAHKA